MEIFLTVLHDCLDKLSDDIATEVRQKGSRFPKTVVFIRKYRHCWDLYALLLHKLGTDFTDPPGYPNIAKYRLIDMFCRTPVGTKLLRSPIITNVLRNCSPHIFTQ